MRKRTLFRIFLFLVSTAVVVVLLVRMKLWSADFTRYFLRTDRWLELIFVMAVGFAVSMIVERLLKWQGRMVDK